MYNMRPTTTPPPNHSQPNSIANNFKKCTAVSAFLFLWVYWVTCFQNGEQAWEKTCPQFIDHDWYSLLHKFRSSLHSKGLGNFHKFWQYYYRFCKINHSPTLCFFPTNNAIYVSLMCKFDSLWWSLIPQSCHFWIHRQEYLPDLFPHWSAQILIRLISWQNSTVCSHGNVLFIKLFDMAE